MSSCSRCRRWPTKPAHCAARRRSARPRPARHSTAATASLGAAGRLSVQGDRATLSVTGVDAPALREWLEAARSAARARPVEAQLMRSGDGYTGTLMVSIGGPP